MKTLTLFEQGIVHDEGWFKHMAPEVFGNTFQGCAFVTSASQEIPRDTGLLEQQERQNDGFSGDPWEPPFHSHAVKTTKLYYDLGPVANIVNVTVRETRI